MMEPEEYRERGERWASLALFLAATPPLLLVVNPEIWGVI